MQNVSVYITQIPSVWHNRNKCPSDSTTDNEFTIQLLIILLWQDVAGFSNCFPNFSYHYNIFKVNNEYNYYNNKSCERTVPDFPISVQYCAGCVFLKIQGCTDKLTNTRVMLYTTNICDKVRHISQLLHKI